MKVKSTIRMGGVLVASTVALIGCAGEPVANDVSEELTPEDFLTEEGPAGYGQAEQELFGRHWWRRPRVRPRIQCVEDLDNGSFRAHWGYRNSGNEARTLSIGHRNKFLWTEANQGQPTQFEPGTHDDVFTTEFQMSKWSPGHVWLLDGRLAWANWFTERCEDVPPTGCTAQGGDAFCDNGLACDGAETCDAATDSCVAGEPVQCGAGDACTGAEVCTEQGGAAVCEAGDVIECSVQGDPQCNDAGSCDATSGCGPDVPVNEGGACSVGGGAPGTCQTGVCVENEPTDCDDGIFCNGVEVEDPNNPGSCLPGTPVACGDGLACNGIEVCSESAQACVPGVPVVCGDGNVCNGGESCSEAAGGLCVPDSEPLNCTATSECNVPVCDPVTGCGTAPTNEGGLCGGNTGTCQNGSCVGTQCEDDGNACNGVEQLNGQGVCVSVNPPQCDDGLFCNGEESCEPATGCVAGTAPACDNGLFCDGTETCDEGADACVAGTAVSCDDGNVCNGTETCDEGANGCVSSPALVCNDGDACTDDSCDPVNGCETTDISNSCDLADECLVGSCDSASGCVTTPVADGVACSANGAPGECSAGVCEEVIVGGCADGSEPVEVVLQHSDRASFNSSDLVNLVGQPWKITGNSYQVRSFDFGGAAPAGPASRAYFTFPLGTVSGEILSGSLRVSQSDTSYDSPDASEDVQLFEVTTPSAELASIPAGGSGTDLAQLNAIFADLGDGAISGPITLSAADDGTVVEIPLTDISSLNAAAGDWSVGADLTSFGNAPVFGSERVWRASESTPSTELVLSVCGGVVAEPVSASFVDTGYFLHAFNIASGASLQSFHFESPQGEHQFYFTGNQNLGGANNVERRSYFVFDVSAVSGTPSSATLRMWATSPNVNNANSGSYESVDASETIELFSVATSPADVINAPFSQQTDHSVDVPIWTDLGDGAVLGSRVFTVADESTDLVPNPFENQSVDCSLDTVSCGKFIEFQLTPAALAEIGAAGGQWALGMTMTSIDSAANTIESVHRGIAVDLDPAKGIDEFRAPAPQLIINP